MALSQETVPCRPTALKRGRGFRPALALLSPPAPPPARATPRDAGDPRALAVFRARRARVRGRTPPAPSPGRPRRRARSLAARLDLAPGADRASRRRPPRRPRARARPAAEMVRHRRRPRASSARSRRSRSLARARPPRHAARPAVARSSEEEERGGRGRTIAIVQTLFPTTLVRGPPLTALLPPPPSPIPRRPLDRPDATNRTNPNPPPSSSYRFPAIAACTRRSSPRWTRW